MSKHKTIDLGLETSFVSLPAPITVEGRSYYLVRGEDGYQLLSTICPHQGGEIKDAGSCFECPYHGWRFEHDTGRCINAPNERLSSFPVTVRGRRLFAEVPLPSVHRAPAARVTKHQGPLTIQLHAHACLEILYEDFSLLTDPWLCGPAFLGAWTHYPATVVNVDKLRPSAIWISHEHSDHFHEPTIVRFDRSTPVYVPDFPNHRLVERLAALGFSNVHAVAFGTTYQISEKIKLTCFEPESMWNDSIVLIEIDGFRLLNVNDAGLNQRIASRVGRVDAVASSFSPGASGYPLTWSHLGDDEKIQIMERARHGMIQMLKEAMKLYGGEYLLPFASHFALWHPAHREYVRLMRRNTVDDVVRAFAESNVQVVDLLPGETWDLSTGQIKRLWRQRERLYDREYMLRYLERRFDNGVFEQHHPTSEEATRAEVESYLLALGELPEVAFCEDLTVKLRAGNADQDSLEVSFEVAAGRLRVVQDSSQSPDVTIEIPSSILHRIITENLSWDEAHIGYWCRFNRSSDVYHAGFWRLLQAPYFNRPPQLPGNDKSIAADSTIADLIENYGEQAERILRRYGLYCAGCHRSTADTVAFGARQHGIEERQVTRLVRELNETFHLAR